MKKYLACSWAALGIVSLALFCAPRDAMAGSWSVYFDTYFGASATDPGTPIPWATMTLSDAGAGTVLLAISNSPSLGSTVKLDDLYLNFNPNLGVNSLNFSLYGSSGGFAAPTVTTGEDSFMVSQDGKFDVKLQFSTGGGGASTFGAGEYALFQISGINGLNADDFKFFSSGNGGQSEAIGHLLGLGTGNGSAWILPGDITTVPEPGIAGLLSVGFGVLILQWRKVRASQ